ncbi:MAG: DUF4433 domain-containing protein [Bacteroides sp.]|nr:DUF4433 domain-containing protein [Bacteroides sp.]
MSEVDTNNAYTIDLPLKMRSYRCAVNYYTFEDIDDLTYVILTILDTNEEGQFTIDALGELLGFAVRNGEDIHGNKIYRDEQEISLLIGILKRLEKLRLLIYKEDLVQMTRLGRLTINSKVVYHFHHAYMELREFEDLHSKMPLALKMYPFSKELDMTGYFHYDDSFWPDDNEVEAIIASRPSQLSKRLNNLQNSPYNIYYAQQEDLYNEIEVSFTFQLGYHNTTYSLLILNKEKKTYAQKINNILDEDINTSLREELILKCRFKKLWGDKTSRFTFKVLQSFLKYVDVSQLANDSRTDWNDKDLVQYISKDNHPNTWIGISRYCPVTVIEESLDKFSERIDWTIFSNRVDEDYLLANFLKYPWDLEILSSSQQISVLCLQTLILQEKETEDEWDWDVLMDILQPAFVKEHIDLIHGNLARYTTNSEEIKSLISQYPDRLWDWSKIVSEFEISFLIDTFSTIYKFINLPILFDRLFIDTESRDYALSKNEFWAILSMIQNRGIQLSSFSANNKDYRWNPSLISKFESLDLIEWNSTDEYCGFDVNPHVNWDETMFTLFHDKLQSANSIHHISKNIASSEIVLKYPDFPWDWTLLSSNNNLVNDKAFLTAASSFLDWSQVIQFSTELGYILELPELDTILKNDIAASRELSKRVSEDYVSSHPLLKWDWSIMTERMFKRLKLERLGHPSFVELWDWGYLSSNLATNFILENLSKFAKYWDWATIIPRLVPQDKLLDPTALSRFAEVLTNVSGDRCTKGWGDWSRIYTFKELKNLILATKSLRAFWWDIEYFSSHPDFDIKSDLVDCRRFVDWHCLSSSEVISKQFIYDEANNITKKRWNEIVDGILTDTNNRWDFTALSHQECFVSNIHFITKFSTKLDWAYLSAHSSIFKETDPQKLSEIIGRFENLIDWERLTSRTDVKFTQGIYNSYHNHSWNLNYLFRNGIIVVDGTIIDENSDYNWDWSDLSDSPNVKLDSETIIRYFEKNWNWFSLSHRTDIVWSKKLCQKVWEAGVDVDWYFITSNTKHGVTASILLGLVEREVKVNWSVISKSKNVLSLPSSLFPLLNWTIILKNGLIDINSYEDLEKYSQFLNWKEVSRLDGFCPTIEILRAYKDKLDWYALCANPSFEINNPIIEEFSDYLDWNKVSESESISLSIELLERYADRWNLNLLEKNRRFSNNRSSLGSFGQDSIINSFVNNFQKGTPKIYHFTHLANAIKIIKTGKIQSRNAAQGSFDNSAGSNVHRTHKAHSFARFYFTTGTPTQFYNECLGKDKGDRYYLSAYRNGLPKCPFPVFFVMELKEVLQANKNKCWYSTGNMQKDATKFYRVFDDPNKIDGINVYDPYDKSAKQQEFLVENELVLENIKSLHIYCFDQEQYDLLMTAVEGSQLSSRVHDHAYGLFLRENKKLTVNLTPAHIRIEAKDYIGEYHFVVDAPDHNLDKSKIEGDIVASSSKKVAARNYIQIPRTEPYRIFLTTELPEPKKWCLFDNTEHIYDGK